MAYLLEMRNGFTFMNQSVQTQIGPYEMQDALLLPNEHERSRRLCMSFFIEMVQCSKFLCQGGKL